MMRVDGLNTSIGKGINSPQNDAERHGNSHNIIANLYRR